MAAPIHARGATFPHAAHPVRAPHRRRRHSHSGGFTLLEVMVALGVLMVALLTLGALQKASVFANRQAREIGTATFFAQQWLERAKVSAINWTAAGPPIDTYLCNSGDSGGCTHGAWFVPDVSSLSPKHSPMADWFGMDWTSSESHPAYCSDRSTRCGNHPRYCANLRTTRLRGAAGSEEELRVEARVWWSYKHQGSSSGAAEWLPSKQCSASYPEGLTDGDLAHKVSMVAVSTVVGYRSLETTP